MDHLWEDSKVGLKWNRENENVCVYNGSVKRTVQEALGWTFGVFQAFFEDEKESRINGWRRNRRSAQSLLPAVRAVDGGFSAVGCGASCERFQSGWRLSSRKRRCSKDFGGALWPFLEKTEVITSLKTGSARQAYFAPL